MSSAKVQMQSKQMLIFPAPKKTQKIEHKIKCHKSARKQTRHTRQFVVSRASILPNGRKRSKGRSWTQRCRWADAESLVDGASTQDSADSDKFGGSRPVIGRSQVEGRWVDRRMPAWPRAVVGEAAGRRCRRRGRSGWPPRCWRSPSRWTPMSGATERHREASSVMQSRVSGSLQAVDAGELTPRPMMSSHQPMTSAMTR